MRDFAYHTTATADQIDVLGHLNNASYLAIFEAARWAVLAETGVPPEVLGQSGVAPVILSVALRFVREVREGEALRVQTSFAPSSPRRFVVHQRMFGPDNSLRAVAELQSGFLDVVTRRMVAPAPALLAALGIEPGELPAAPVVQGLGGAFLYANDVDTLAAWYTRTFGLELEVWGDARGIELPSADRVPSARIATTTFALLQADEPLPAVRTGRVNFRVGDLDGLVARLTAAGERVERGPDEPGRFFWVWDPEGNKVELWEPPRGDG